MVHRSLVHERRSCVHQRLKSKPSLLVTNLRRVHTSCALFFLCFLVHNAKQCKVIANTTCQGARVELPLNHLPRTRFYVRFSSVLRVFRIRSSSRSLRTQCRVGPSLCGVHGWVLGLGKTGHPLIHIRQGDSSVPVHLRVDLRGGERNASNADRCHGDASRMDIEQRECLQERNGEANGFRSKDMEDES